MQCRNHSDVEAIDRCAGCSEVFCGNCLVEIHGQKYCASCKVMTLPKGSMAEESMVPCKQASDAFIFAILGAVFWIICGLGVIFGPIAIVKAAEARRLMDRDPRLLGSGKALASLVLGIVDIGFSLLILIAIVRQSNL